MQIAVNVIVLASLYCLVCCGYVLVYRSSRVLNLAHGELMTLGAYFLLTVIMAFPGNPLVSFMIAAGLSLLLGLAVYFFLMRFMTGESVFAAVLVTISLGILLRGVVTLIWTSQSWHPASVHGNRKRLSSTHRKWRDIDLRHCGRCKHNSNLCVPLSVLEIHPLGLADACGGRKSSPGRPKRDQHPHVLCLFVGDSGFDSGLGGNDHGLR